MAGKYDQGPASHRVIANNILRPTLLLTREWHLPKMVAGLVALKVPSRPMPSVPELHPSKNGATQGTTIFQACQGILSRLDMAFAHLRILQYRDWHIRLTD